MQYFTLYFLPLLPWSWFAVLAVFCFILFAWGVYRRARGILWRGLSLLLVLLVLANPSAMQEQREPIRDSVLVVTDRSPSQRIGNRMELTDAALENIRRQLAAMPEFEPVYLNIDGEMDETRLWEPMREAALDIEGGALAGILLITDGQVHDAPDHLEERLRNIPIHTIYTGDKDEKDISVIVTEAPRYAMVDDEITVTVRIDAHGLSAREAQNLRLHVMQDGRRRGVFPVQVGQEVRLRFKMERAGDTVLSFTVPKIDGELTAVNNTAVAVVRTIRDRLRVLLISGKPHAGERTWRNMLNSDPAVDLVHFTILRSRDARDATPSHEMSLIRFPTHELFQRKINHFDLIIFDRYHLQGILEAFYFRNIRDYVVNHGGALLVSSGDEYGGDNSLYNTMLRTVIPARPTGGTVMRGFVPARTDLGEVHPVTEMLTDRRQAWGRWFRQVRAEVTDPEARILMTGADDLPLLTLSHAGRGRVAWLGSDHAWLWTRGLEGGGPQKELLRRMAHWLMKEPDLEEHRLSVSVSGYDITVRRRAMLDADHPIEISMFTPEQEERPLTMRREGQRRWHRVDVQAEQYGLYRFDDPSSDQVAFAVVGRLDVPEMQNVITTNEILAPLTAGTGGGEIWFNTPERGFELRARGGLGLRMHGENWLGLKQNDAYRVTGLKNYALLPPFWAMLVIALLIMMAWFREGRAAR
ncbi:MAG: hypothetical protein EA357_01420 [Micavibrio sp.]|nr:MAG: hypothetical protein EA357_01420 [Micavibrio sp.]